MPSGTYDLTAASDNLLDAVQQGQDLTLDAVRLFTDAVRPVTDRLPKPPFAGQLPSPADAVDAGYDFLEKWLASQRRFSKELVGMLTPSAAERS